VKRTERQFVARLQRQAEQHLPRAGRMLRLSQGIGDDCAVLSGSGRSDLLVTTDLFAENVHFRRRWQDPDSIGHKVLARGLSDIAAMGGTPRFAFLSLAMPQATADAWIAEFFRGLFLLAKAHGVALAGGDTSASASGLVADIVVLGEVPRATAVLRSGAHPGDEIWVSGQLGGAAHALAGLRKGVRPRRAQSFERLFYPQPRLRVGSVLRQRKLVSAMIDLSDGLSIDLARLCEASGAAARIEQDAIPRASHATLIQALHGGEDLELLFTVPPARSHGVPKAIGGVPLTRIGKIIPGRRLLLARGNRVHPLPVLGFQHF